MDTKTPRQDLVFAVVTTVIGIGLWAALVAELAIKMAQPGLA